MTINSKMDFLDVKILNTVQQDARITKTKLSEEIGLSATPCHIRLKRLEEEGIISGYYADINYTAFGDYSFYWVQARILDYTRDKAFKFEEIIMKEPASLECISTLGKVDYLLKIIDYYNLLIDGAEVIDVRGMSYLPFFNKWCWIEDTRVNFALRAVKPDRSPEVTSDTQTNTET